MPHSFNADRVYHPAVLMRGAEWPAILEAHAEHNSMNVDAEIRTAYSHVELLIVDGSSHAIAAFPPLEHIYPLDLSLQEILNLKLALRWHSILDPTPDLDLPKKDAKFELQSSALHFIRAGMMHIAQTEGQFDDPKAAVDSIPDEAIAEFAFSKIDAMFFSLADSYIISGNETPQVATEGGFDDTIRSALFERFEFDRVHIKEFSDSIYRSVWGYLRMGGSFSGEWGKLAYVGKNIYMILSIKKTANYNNNNDIELSFSDEIEISFE